MTPEIGPLMAAALNEALQDPDFVALLNELGNDPSGTPFIPPSTAAARRINNTTMLEAVTGKLGPSASWIDAGTESGNNWIQLGMLAELAGWTAGESRTCMHAPSPLGTVPVKAAAWTPGLVVCMSCTHLQELHTDEKFRCDCCGRMTTSRPDNSDDDELRLVYGNVGMLWFEAGVCSDCIVQTPVEEN